MSSPVTLCGSLSLHAVTLGATIHEAGYAALDLPWRYVPFEIGPSDLEGALAAMRTLSIRGFGISMPFKEQILPLLDAIDPLAARIGAVNTVVNEAGRLVGHNTDAAGAVRAIAEAMPVLGGAPILVLGAGGAARAVAFALHQEGAAVAIANRHGERARVLAEEIGCASVPWQERHALDRFAAVVNATSIGMRDVAPGSPLDEAAFPSTLVVMDIVYHPVETELVTAARRAACPTIHGGRMLLHQAARQFELYTGRPAPLEAMNAALERAIVDPRPPSR